MKGVHEGEFMFCRECGENLQKGYKSCSNCGRKQAEPQFVIGCTGILKFYCVETSKKQGQNIRKNNNYLLFYDREEG